MQSYAAPLRGSWQELHNVQTHTNIQKHTHTLDTHIHTYTHTRVQCGLTGLVNAK